MAIDGDSNPNLAAALGISRDLAASLEPLPSSLVSRRLDGGPALRSGIDEVIAAHAICAADGISVLMMGMPAHAEEGCMCSAHATASAVLADLGTRPDTVTVFDLEASPEHFGRGTARHADVLLLVTEPYWRSLETSRRMADLARELPIPRIAVVASKVRSPDDVAAITEFCSGRGLEMIGAIPRSDTVLDADAAERSLVDVAATGDPVIQALRSLQARLLTTAAAA